MPYLIHMGSEATVDTIGFFLPEAVGNVVTGFGTAAGSPAAGVILGTGVDLFAGYLYDSYLSDPFKKELTEIILKVSLAEPIYPDLPIKPIPTPPISTPIPPKKY